MLLTLNDLKDAMSRETAEDLLLHSLANALSVALDERTHFNVTHTQNMIMYARNFLAWLDSVDSPKKFDHDKKNAFLLAIWLHDVGKLTIPVHIMAKPTRLGYMISHIEDRFKIIHLLNELAYSKGQISSEEYTRAEAELEEAAALVSKINNQGYLANVEAAKLNELKGKTYVDEIGKALPWFTREEIECLSIRRGTLTVSERKKMEGHVVATSNILNNVVFPERYKDIPLWASGHHELLDGSGYPNKLKADQIPSETRLLTILDIFEALTAVDRPYKKSVPVEGALKTLRHMAENGKIDAEWLSLFEESKAWITSNSDTERAAFANIFSLLK